MEETILSKDTICINISDDHSYNCNTVAIGRAGENAITQLEITIPEELNSFWAYLDFKKPKGAKHRTPGLEIVNNIIEYNIPKELLNETGNLEVQLVLQNENGEIWKSNVKKYVVLKSIDAVDDIPFKEDFITEAQKILSQTVVKQDGANALKGSASGEKAVAVKDVSPIEHDMAVAISLLEAKKICDLATSTEALTRHEITLGGAYEVNKTYKVSLKMSVNTISYLVQIFFINSTDGYAKSEAFEFYPSVGGEEFEVSATLSTYTTTDNTTFDTLIVMQEGNPCTVSEASFSVLNTVDNITLTRYGKNLFDKDSATTGYTLDTTTGEPSASANYSLSAFIRMPNVVFTLNISSRYAKICCYNAEREFLGTPTRSGIVYTPIEGTFYIRVAVNSNYLSTAQVELGNAATTYEAYALPETVNADLNGNAIIKSIYPSLTLMAGHNAENISVTSYNRDINKAFAELTQAIISLGGNI